MAFHILTFLGSLFFYLLSTSTKSHVISCFVIFRFTFLSPIYINKISWHSVFWHCLIHFFFISYLYQQNLMAFRILTLSDSLFFYLLSISTKFHVITYFDIFCVFSSISYLNQQISCNSIFWHLLVHFSSPIYILL